MDKPMVASQPVAENGAGERVSGLLRRALLGNTVFSSTVAVVCILDARAIAEWLGITHPLALVVMGLVILAFAPYLLWVATRRPLNRPAARLIFWLDVAWVIASPVIVILDPFSLTVPGHWAVGIVGLVVLDIAIVEYIGLHRIERANSHRSGGTA